MTTNRKKKPHRRERAAVLLNGPSTPPTPAGHTATGFGDAGTGGLLTPIDTFNGAPLYTTPGHRYVWRAAPGWTLEIDEPGRVLYSTTKGGGWYLAIYPTNIAFHDFANFGGPGSYFNDQAALDAAYALDASALPVSINPPQFGAFIVPAFGTLSGTGADNQWEIRDGDPRPKAGNALYLGHHAAVAGPYELLVGSNNPALPPAGSVS